MYLRLLARGPEGAHRSDFYGDLEEIGTDRTGIDRALVRLQKAGRIELRKDTRAKGLKKRGMWFVLPAKETPMIDTGVFR